MKWWLPILIVLGSCIAAALAQDMTNGLNNKGTQAVDEKRAQ